MTRNREVIAIRVPDLRESAHRAASRGTGVVRGQSLRACFRLEAIKVVRQLRVQVGVEPAPAEHVDARGPRSPFACRLGEKLGHQRHRQFPALGFLANLSPSACRQLVELGLPVVVRDAPARLDPSSLLQPKERGIQRALIQVEEALRHLEDPLGESEPVLRSHRGERPQHHQIERALQYFS